MVGISYIVKDTDIALVVGSVVALFTVMFVDYFEILSKHHPNTWRALKYIVIAIIILLTLIGFASAI